MKYPPRSLSHINMLILFSMSFVTRIRNSHYPDRPCEYRYMPNILNEMLIIEGKYNKKDRIYGIEKFEAWVISQQEAA